MFVTNKLLGTSALLVVTCSNKDASRNKAVEKPTFDSGGDPGRSTHTVLGGGRGRGGGGHLRGVRQDQTVDGWMDGWMFSGKITVYLSEVSTLQWVVLVQCC